MEQLLIESQAASPAHIAAQPTESVGEENDMQTSPADDEGSISGSTPTATTKQNDETVTLHPNESPGFQRIPLHAPSVALGAAITASCVLLVSLLAR